MSVYYGVVRGNTIVLPDGVRLPEGHRVEVRDTGQPAKATPRPSDFAAIADELRRAGLLLDLKRPPTASPDGIEHTPVPNTGRPAFEMIAEDRP